ncbi:hypothetical protein OBBRIDRAFT_159752 [Obba rivulosa]|uniref:Uncharacterized protein n=1 Tax=Obba rivulosa TaxID=1052685 RepID=A0A8E2ASM4_9APHY|nr:hypothetical protein OBBRIDRAFT_159752 [Obba rivulosa]
MFKLFPGLLVLVAALSLSVHAAPRGSGPSVKIFADSLGTNAQRLAVGLPPLPPKRRATGTRSVSASPSPSPRPPTTFTGHLEARSNNGTTVGFVKNTAGGVDGIVPPSDPGTLEVSFSTTATPGAPPFSILATNPAFPPPFNVGGNGTAALGSGSPDVVAINHVGFTSPFSPPSIDAGGESSIWSYSTSTKEITAQWINPDGSHPTTFIGWNSTANFLFLSGDLSAYNHAHSPAILQLVSTLPS